MDREAAIYRKKCKKLKRIIKDLVFENAALCDEAAHIQEQELMVREERKYLLKKYYQFQSVADVDVPVQVQTPVAQPSAVNAPLVTPEPVTVKKVAPKRRMASEPQPQEASVVPKTRRTVCCTITRPRMFVQPIPLDFYGRPIFPLVLGGPTVHSLGEVVYDRPAYHTEQFIFPVGFCSTRVYGSLHDPEMKCVFTCKILDGGMFPSFEIVADNDLDAPLVAKSANDCHSMLLRQINNAVGYDVVNTKGCGPEFFGLSHPTVQNLIQSCPGTRKCSLYKWSKFEVSQTAELPTEENDASLNFEALQRSIAFYKLYMHMLQEERQPEPVTRENNLRDLLMA